MNSNVKKVIVICALLCVSQVTQSFEPLNKGQYKQDNKQNNIQIIQDMDIMSLEDFISLEKELNNDCILFNKYMIPEFRDLVFQLFIKICELNYKIFLELYSKLPALVDNKSGIHIDINLLDDEDNKLVHKIVLGNIDWKVEFVVLLKDIKRHLHNLTQDSIKKYFDIRASHNKTLRAQNIKDILNIISQCSKIIDANMLNITSQYNKVINKLSPNMQNELNNKDIISTLIHTILQFNRGKNIDDNIIILDDQMNNLINLLSKDNNVNNAIKDLVYYITHDEFIYIFKGLGISLSSDNTKDNIINELLNSILKILDNCKDKSIICKNKSVITYNIKKLLTNKKLKPDFDYEFLSNIKEQISNYEYINSITENLRGIIAKNENLLLEEYNPFLKKIK